MVLLVKTYMKRERSECCNYLNCMHQRYQVIFRIMDVMIMDVISEEYPAQPPVKAYGDVSG